MIKRHKIAEVADVTKLAGFEFTKYIEYVSDGEIIAIRALNLKDGKLLLDDIKMIKRAVSNSLPRSKLHLNDIVLSYTGTVGEVAQIDEDNKYHLAPNVAKITPNEKIVNPKYLYYYIRGNEFKQQMLNHAHGSTQKTVPMKVIRELTVPLCDRKIQDKIAEILSSFDDKIALNNKINDNLEWQAQAIFYKYFIDSDKIPDGWSVGCLLDIADYRNGLAMQKYRPAAGEVGLPVLKIKELRQGNCDATSELCSPNINTDYIVSDGDVVFSWSGSLLVDLWCGGTCGLNQHLFKVTSAKYDKWFYYLWTKYYLDRFVAIAADKATTMGHIKREELSKAEVIIPSSQDYQEIGVTLQPMIDLIIVNRIENRKLVALRDILLPKLMLGESK